MIINNIKNKVELSTLFFIYMTISGRIFLNYFLKHERSSHEKF